MPSHLFSRSSLIGAGPLVLWVSGALAQSQPVQQPPAASNGELQDIIVTAQRREESLQRTPIAVTALSSEQLTQRNIQSTLDLMQVVPGLEISTASSGQGTATATVFIRGMGLERSTNGQDPAVGVYIDDFYYPSLDGAMFKIVDLAQVEVLRGPQGTLFGRDTLGGAIRYTTQVPDFSAVSGHIEGTYGSLDRKDITADLNVPLSANSAVRLTGGVLDSSGYVERENDPSNDAGGVSDELGRIQYRWDPTSSLDIDLGVQFSRTIDYGFPYAVRSINVPHFGSAPAWNAAHAGDPALQYNDQWISTCNYCQPGTTVADGATTTLTAYTSKVTWSIADALTFKSLTSFQRVNSTSNSDTDGTPLPIQAAAPQIDNHSAWSQEFQLAGAAFGGRLSYVGGLYFYHEQWTYILDAVQYGVDTPTTPYYQTTISGAGYLDATYEIVNDLKLIGGVRYSEDNKKVSLDSLSGDLLDTAQKTFPSTTGRVGVQEQWDPKVMSYFTISKGFRAGGFSEDGGNISTFSPETATNFEVGTRMDLLNGVLRLNPTAFYTRWDDIQIQYQKVTPTFARYFVVENAAKAHSYGFELESEAAITDKFRLYGNMSYLHEQYDSVGTAEGITVNSHFERAPPETYSLGARYQTPIFNGYTTTSSVNWSWQALQYSTPTDVDHLRLPSYALLGARFEVVDPSAKWTVAVFGTNLTNKLYYIGGLDYASFIGESQWYLGPPRAFGISLRRSF